MLKRMKHTIFKLVMDIKKPVKYHDWKQCILNPTTSKTVDLNNDGKTTNYICSPR